jgi:hypothetical protein
MTPWNELLLRPEGGSVHLWLTQLAESLLTATRLYAGGEPHRLIEVEVYYHAADHADVFAHRDPIQLHRGLWYFHKTRGTYRSGSFKGLDLTFGDGTAHGGVLLRGLETADGTIVDGPSLLVDYLLAKTGQGGVAALDRTIARRPAWDAGNPLRLEATAEEDRRVYQCSRIGLSLKRIKPSSESVSFLTRQYRFLSEPRRTAKGRLYLVLGLHRQGVSPDDIRAATGCTAATIRRYLDDYDEAKRAGGDLDSFAGIELGPQELCRLHGLADRG